MIKRFVIVAILCGVVVGALVYFNNWRADLIAGIFANRQIPPVTVTATVVTSETWPSGIEAIGTIRAVEGVEVASQVAGKIEEIAFDANDRAEAGQLLVRLDDAVEQANVALYQAQVTLARRTLERVTTLRNQGNASAASFDEAEAALDQAEAQLASNQALIDQKRIEAPFSGVIGIPKVNLGQFVSAGEPLATLQNLDRVHVDFNLPQAAIDTVEIGQAVELQVDAYPGRTFTGTITGIDPNLSAETRTLPIRATLDNPGGMLLPGVFARVNVVLPPRPEVVTVPQTAVSFSLYGDTVYVIEEAPPAESPAPDGQAAGQADAAEPAEAEQPPAEAAPALVVRQTFVRVGERRGDIAEILEGLEPGQRVVTSGQIKLQNGYPVVIDNTVDPAQFALGPS